MNTNEAAQLMGARADGLSTKCDVAIPWSAIFPRSHVRTVSDAYATAFRATAHLRTYSTRAGYLAAMRMHPELRELAALERAMKVATHYAYGK